MFCFVIKSSASSEFPFEKYRPPKKKVKVFLTKEQDICEIVQQHMQILFSERVLGSNGAVNQCHTGELTCKVNGEGILPEEIPEKPRVNRNASALPQMQIYKGAETVTMSNLSKSKTIILKTHT